MIDPSIFKSYDVRGIYPGELNEEAAYLIGRAFVAHTGAENVVLCHDARLSSPALFTALAKGIMSQGAAVTSIGQLPTECLYFAVASYDFDAGIMVTASHNPKEYNGFKMLRRNVNDLNIVRGKELLALVESQPKSQMPAGEIRSKDILQDYRKYVFSLFELGAMKKFKVAVDASNGVMGNVLAASALPVDIIPLNFEPDGNFPNHAPNPLEPGASDQIREAVEKHSADFGFIFDADADRIFLVDEKGDMAPADLVLVILAKYCLEKSPGAGVAYNAVCSKAVPEFVKQYGGIPIRTQVGAVNVRDGLLKNNGVVGGEVSAHYCFKDYFYMDSGLMAMLAMLHILSQDGRKVSEIIKSLQRYRNVAMNFTVQDKESMLEKIKHAYGDGKQDFLDGITVEYQDWWLNARLSNTEPLLRLTIEANTQELLEQKKAELSKLVNS